MLTNNNQNALEKILINIGVYLKPECLKLEYKDKINTDGVNKEKLNKYFNILSNVDYFYKRVLKYELYFAEFYPNTKKIKKHEALEYHIYAYLENVDILRNKIRGFLGTLKHDLKNIAMNKKEIEQVEKKFIENIEKIFTEIKDYRHPHHHADHRLLDSNIIDTEYSLMILDDNFSLKNRVNVDVETKKAEDSFQKAKKSWVEFAKKNNKQFFKLINVVFNKKKQSIYTILKIESIEEILK